MIIENKHEVGHYPFKQDEDITKVRKAIGLQYSLILRFLPLNNKELHQTFETLACLFIAAEAPFLSERKRRWEGDKSANLYYHNLNHTYQTGFDATAIANYLICRQDFLTTNLSKEAFIALPVAGIFHDSGYIFANPLSDNLAAHTPIHVESSIKSAREAVETVKFPNCFDNQKIKELITQGIHNTHFPFTKEKETERKVMIAELPKQWRKEAMIIRLTTQLADLGGQTIRVDQYPSGTKLLREEINAATPNLGTKIVGTDEELIENAKKFTKTMVLPTVGKTANAFFGKQNPYQKTWQELLNK